MKKISNYLAITSCFVLATTLAHADTDSESYHAKIQEKMFNAMDINSDGLLTNNEYKSFFSNKFKDLDVHGNGQITLEEMKAGFKRMDDVGRKRMDDSGRNKMGDDGRNRIDNRETQTNQMSRTHQDNSNPRSETRSAGGSNESCCWAPTNSGGKRSNTNMNNSKDNDNDDND
ncbi:MAG: hypothetical protein ABIR84_03395 [Candidatus Nitrotoga sp.]